MNPEKQKVGIVYGLIVFYTRLYQTVLQQSSSNWLIIAFPVDLNWAEFLTETQLKLLILV